ncbi:MAG TPA: RNA polymerase sigma factor [Sphingomicrobium sp.]|nr:RNA polymerase sigma factor [Sphingomicrobium sp.]
MALRQPDRFRWPWIEVRCSSSVGGLIQLLATMPSSLLQTLILTMRPSLLRFFAARGASHDEAEDLAQDLYLKAGNISAHPIGEPRAYLYRMADNLFLDRRRSAIRRQKREEAWGELLAADLVAAGRSQVDDARHARDQLAVIEDALASLPDRTAEIFRRFRIEGEKQRAIAEDFGISLSAVEKHLQRAYEVVLNVKDRSNSGDLDLQLGKVDSSGR